MKVNHGVVSGVYCPKCPKHFKNKKTLNNHKNKKHTGTKKLSIQIEDYSENDVYNDSDVSDEEDFGDVKEDNKKEDDKAIDSLDKEEQNIMEIKKQLERRKVMNANFMKEHTETADLNQEFHSNKEQNKDTDEDEQNKMEIKKQLKRRKVINANFMKEHTDRSQTADSNQEFHSNEKQNKDTDEVGNKEEESNVDIGVWNTGTPEFDDKFDKEIEEASTSLLSEADTSLNESDVTSRQEATKESYKNTKVSCENCHKSMTKESLTRHKKNKSCKKTKNHEVIVTTNLDGIDSNVTSCDTCAETFKHRVLLKRHKNEGICSKEHSIKENLEKKCPTCDKTFTTKQLLRNHECRKEEQFYSPPSSPNFMLGKSKQMTYQALGATLLLIPNTMARVSRERGFLRRLARQPLMKVQEEEVLRRAEALTPLQVQKVLEGRVERVEMKMEWVVKICKEMMDLEEEEEADSTNTTKVDSINAKITNTSSSNVETTMMSLTTKPAKKNVKSPLKRGKDKNTESNQTKRRKVESNESNEEKKQTGINETNVCTDNGSILWTPELAGSFERLKLISPRLVAGSVTVEMVVGRTGLQGEVVRAWQDSLAQFIPRPA